MLSPSNQIKIQDLKREHNPLPKPETQDNPVPAQNRRFGFNIDSVHRKQSVSKSCVRETSMTSLVDYTLKFLNDDMGVTLRAQEPLIEKSQEDD